MSADDPLPRVPGVDNPTHETPLTEDFETGTANDPPVGAAAETTLTVDGTEVTVPAGATLLDAVEAAGAGDDVAALCRYDRESEATDLVGPRSTCRTCTVEADGDLVASCSRPARDGTEVRTDAAEAAEAREVNLDLVLSNHNLRCTTCGKNGRCELQDTAVEQGVEHPRYGVFDDRSEYEPLDDSSPNIQIDRNKCITCNRCVEACNDVQVQGVLRIEGTGEDTRIGFMSDAETMADSQCVSCGHCATVCPTGSLVETGYADAQTLPIPGFNQKNSIGKTVGGEDRPDPAEGKSGVARFMARARASARDAGERGFLAAEHAAEAVAAKTLPEGRLFDVADATARFRGRDIDATETTCGYCAVGCRFEVHTKGDEVLGVRATDPEGAPANDFSTCVKGKFGYEFAGSDDRLTKPLVRRDGDLEPASWDEALDRVVEGFERIRDDYGPEALAAFASSKATNEENYLMQRLARDVLRTPNIDNCARLCHSSTVAALLQTVGYGAMTNSIADVAGADAYLITGSNTTESHPVLATRIKQNVRDGADLVVFDPRRTGIAEHADQYTRTDPGYDVAWLNGLTRYVIEHDLHDADYVEEHVHGFDELREKVEPFTPAEVERLAGVPPEELASAAETLADAENVVFGWAMGLTQHSHGTANVLAVANLALVLGQVGKPNAGLSPFRGHNNVQGGGGDMGTLPNKLPGYRDPADPDVRADFADVWGAEPPAEYGLKVPEVFDAALDGEVRGLYVMGENPALSEPDIGHADEALDALEFLVVQDLFRTETAEHADVVLPAASFAETDGTFTNTERRVQRVRPARDAPGKARADFDILTEVAARFGADWDYDSPADAMDEIASLAPIYGGISHDRLDAEGGLQWPCRDADDPGTRYLYEDGFNFEDGKARFVPADMGRPGELPDETYPLTLTTGRVMYHFHTGTLTRRAPGLTHHVPESFVEIHPATAESLGVADDEYVRVASARGSVVVRAFVTDRVGEGVVFVPMHFAEGAANALTQGDTVDPESGIPEYKVSSVRVERVEGETEPSTLAGAPGDD
ncbi:formate dehydrogenase subunit alpha [Halosegnis marinus]|uniref:Formate dehydrogenase subunit alpha n=1 Tax=Halosegnis marinus TaxID=3034023 RepID=A0ABD5ZL71_9EURY|nr:formate dehydrogenase subunit alpha [Halosegnis sp. DT85]